MISPAPAYRPWPRANGHGGAAPGVVVVLARGANRSSAAARAVDGSASGINDAGVVVGDVFRADGYYQHGVRWLHGRILGRLPALRLPGYLADRWPAELAAHAPLNL